MLADLQQASQGVAAIEETERALHNSPQAGNIAFVNGAFQVRPSEGAAFLRQAAPPSGCMVTSQYPGRPAPLDDRLWACRFPGSGT